MSKRETSASKQTGGPGEDPSKDERDKSASGREAAEREAVRKMTRRTPEDLHPDAKPKQKS